MVDFQYKEHSWKCILGRYLTWKVVLQSILRIYVMYVIFLFFFFSPQRGRWAHKRRNQLINQSINLGFYLYPLKSYGQISYKAQLNVHLGSSPSWSNFENMGQRGTERGSQKTIVAFSGVQYAMGRELKASRPKHQFVSEQKRKAWKFQKWKEGTWDIQCITSLFALKVLVFHV